ncbi:hypothetical protein ACHAXS_012583 [Conticribra weissflogii]
MGTRNDILDEIHQTMINKAISSPGFMGVKNSMNGTLSNYGGTSGNEEWAAPSVSAGDQSKGVGGGETSVFANSTLAVATAFGFLSGMSSKTASSGCVRATPTRSFGSKGKLKESQPSVSGPNDEFVLRRSEPRTTAALRNPVENKPKDFVGCEISFPKGYDSDDGTETSEITLYTNRMETMREELIMQMMKARMSAGVVAGHMTSKSAGLAFDPNNKSIYQSNSGTNLVPTSMGIDMEMGMTRCVSASALRNVNPRSKPSMSRLDETEDEHGEAPSRGNECIMLHSTSHQATMKKSSSLSYFSKKSAGLAFDPHNQSRLQKNLSTASACGLKSQSNSFITQLENVQEEIDQGNQNVGNGKEKFEGAHKKTNGFWMKCLLQSETHTPDTVLSQKNPNPISTRTSSNEKLFYESPSANSNFIESRRIGDSNDNCEEVLLSQKQSDLKDSRNNVTWVQRLLEAEANPKSLLNRRKSDNDERSDNKLLVATRSQDLEESKKDVSWMQRLLQDETNSSSFLTKRVSAKSYDRNSGNESDDEESKKIVHNEDNDYSEEVCGNPDTLEDVDNNTKSTSKTTKSSLLNSIIELKMEFAHKQSLIDELSSKVSKHDKLVKERDDMIQTLELQNEKLRTENELLRMQLSKLKNPSCNTLISVRKTKE